MENQKRASRAAVICYGFGDLASQFVWTFVGSYLTLFYTDVVGLAPAIVSVIMMGARIWDAVNDPMMGGNCRTDTLQIREVPPLHSVWMSVSGTVWSSDIYKSLRRFQCGRGYMGSGNIHHSGNVIYIDQYSLCSPGGCNDRRCRTEKYD